MSMIEAEPTGLPSVSTMEWRFSCVAVIQVKWQSYFEKYFSLFESVEHRPILSPRDSTPSHL